MICKIGGLIFVKSSAIELYPSLFCAFLLHVEIRGLRGGIEPCFKFVVLLFQSSDLVLIAPGSKQG
jgi:hypothetical protein